jgi:hypothetical protein
LTTGRTNVVQTTTNIASASPGWTPVSTNIASASSATFTNTISAGPHFFRLVQLP